MKAGDEPRFRETVPTKEQLMNTLRTRRVILLIVLLPLAVAFPALASGKHSGINVSIDSDRGVERCDDIRVRFDSRAAERAEDTFSMPASASPFRVELPVHSGIRIAGWDRNEYSVTACKAARRADDLGEIQVKPDGAGLAFRGPSGEDWLVFVLVKAPREAALDLEAKNGSISVKDFAGKVTARTSNGPIDLENCSGAVQVNANNGPISLEGCSGSGEARAVNGPIDFTGSEGSYRISTQNGPISVELEGDRWNGGTLDASAVNGPLSLKIADGYRSGVRLEVLGHGPVTCPDEPCRSARKTWDENAKRIEFGDSDPVVRLSTRNGPVSVESKR
jgi:hypothetical protein